MSESIVRDLFRESYGKIVPETQAKYQHFSGVTARN